MLICAKKILPLCLLALVISCSSKKETLEGTRISIVDRPRLAVAKTQKENSFALSEAVNLETWSQTGSNARHLYQNMLISEETKKLWTSDFGESASKRNLLMAVPVVANGVVYAQDVSGKISAFDLKTGELLFQHKLKSLNKNETSTGLNGAGLAVYDKNLYATAGFGGVFALNALTGKPLWRTDLNIPIRSAPTVANDMLFVQTINNQLFCLSAKDGSEIWRYNISAEDTVLAGGSAPAFDASKQILVTIFSNGELQAFNASIGYPIWSQDLTSENSMPFAIQSTKTSPVIDGHTVYAAGSHTKTIAADLETGEIIWEIPVGGISSPLVDKEAVFMVSSDYELLAVNKKSGQILWRTPVLNEMDLQDRRNISVFAPLLLNNTLFVITSNGIVLRFDPFTGEPQPEASLDGDIALQPIVADYSLITATQNAKLIVYK